MASSSNENSEAEPRCAIRSKTLSAEEREALVVIFEKEFPIFQEKGGRFGRFRGWECRPISGLALRKLQPVRYPPLRIPDQHLQAFKEHLRGLMILGLIQPSRSPWGMQTRWLTCDGVTGLALDFSDMNRVLRLPETSPLAFNLLVNGRQRYWDARYFSLLGITMGSLQIPLGRESRPVTAFTTPVGQYEWKVMPTDILGGQDALDRALAETLEGCEGCVAIRGQSILVFSDQFQDHLNDLRVVAGRLWDAGFTSTTYESDVGQTDFKKLTHGHYLPGVCAVCLEVSAADLAPTSATQLSS